MFKFRGQKYYTDEWITGYLTSKDHIDGEWIKPETLSVSFGKLDSTNTEIFASFEVDGKMTEGGDVVRYAMGEGYDYAIKYSIEDGAFVASGHGNQTWQYVHELFEFPQYTVTIIGKQGGGNE